MVFNSRTYFLLFATLLALSIHGVGKTNRSQLAGGSVPEFLIEPNGQDAALEIEELFITEDSVRPRARADIARSPSALTGPGRLEGDSAGHLFVIDDGNSQLISELSPAGEILRTFNGPAAPQMKSVADIAVLQDSLWVADLLGSAIHTLDRTSGRWKTSTTDVAPYRIEPFFPGQESVVMRIGTSRLFDITSNPNGEVLKTFGRLVNDQKMHALALDGFVARSGGSIVFTGKHLGILASFSKEGGLNYLIDTIAPPERPIVMNRNGKRWVHRTPIQASISIASDADGVYVLTSRKWRMQLRYFIDLYRAKDGGYYKSLILPAHDRYTSVTLGGDHLCVAGYKGIVGWPREVLAASRKRTLLSTGRSIIEFSGIQPKKGSEP